MDGDVDADGDMPKLSLAMSSPLTFRNEDRDQEEEEDSSLPGPTMTKCKRKRLRLLRARGRWRSAVAVVCAAWPGVAWARLSSPVGGSTLPLQRRWQAAAAQVADADTDRDVEWQKNGTCCMDVHRIHKLKI
jgi:hypothetical protein